VRVVPNKYPALVPELLQPEATTDVLLGRRPARGHYEVIIEGAEHRRDLAPATPDVLVDVLQVAQERYRTFRADPALRFFSLFKNHGVRAGASLIHPHWQLVAGPMVPPLLQRMVDVASDYAEQCGASVYDDYVQRELEVGARIIEEREAFVVLAPYAPQWSGETWIIPRTVGVSVGTLSPPQEVREFAVTLRGTLERLARAFADPDVNVLILSGELSDRVDESFRWHVRIQPRLTTPGGFELATGTAIVTVDPEQTAEMLRAVRVES
jgi:UDPglucose--hexose-1-phosphate uridylyltransferase